jgi:hypothetical protein
MRQTRWTVGSVVVGLLLAGCAAPTGPAGAPAGPNPSSAPAAADPLALIGLWTVTEADEEEGAILRLAERLTLFRTCGYAEGTWRATTDGLFLGDTFGGSCGSGPKAHLNPDWLRRAAGFRADGDARLLLDEEGETVARLLPGARLTPSPNLAPQEAAPPVVDDAARRIMAPASPVPANLRPAVRSDLPGRWVPVGNQWNAKAFVEFAHDGEMHGSDGCNGNGGLRWLSGRAGAVVATTGLTTLMACNNAPIQSWLAHVYRAGFDGDVLVLLDQAGKELGRLRRG